MKKLTITLLLAATLPLSACAVTSAGVKKGDERNLARSINDVSAARAIKARMTRALDFNLKGVDVEVAEGVVLLSGNVRNPDARLEAERIAWSGPGITQVGNELRVDGKQGLVDDTKDRVLNSSIKARFMADKTVKARNYNIEAHEGTVYLLGVARSPQELERAAYLASTTKGVMDVVSYVRLASDVRANYNTSKQTYPDYGAPEMADSTAQYRPLPDSLSTEPSGDETGVPKGSSAGAYGSSAAGQAVSEMETEPYYIDPDTGEHIPVSYIMGR
ncbi:MAG: BON domain-containing protein [Maricaulaceae bacterium]